MKLLFYTLLISFNLPFFLFSFSENGNSSLYAQTAQQYYTLTGLVTDETNQPLEGATIFLEGTNIVTVSNKFGFYSITRLLKGNYTIVCSYVGYNPIKQQFNLKKHDHIDFKLTPEVQERQGVNVTAQRKASEIATIAATKVNERTLEENGGKALGEILKSVSGLNSITTGPSISKPVIHGLHSNRVLILNNGVRHESQQWGLEHAPEIDPFLANNITIIKGAASIRYGSDAIAGVILMQPTALPLKGITGDVHLVGTDNYGMQAVSGNVEIGLEKQFKGLAFRAQATTKKAGNSKTPGYYLKNTGFTENDLAFEAAYNKDGFKFDVFYSLFSTTVGIFEGSHVGNATELYDAIHRTTPNVTADFSYDIIRSKQKVNHSLLKAVASYQSPKIGKMELIYGNQVNNRQEYDIDLPFSSDPKWLTEPQIDFKIYTDALNFTYSHPTTKNGFAGQIGVDAAQQTNICDGLRYLVPNFRSLSGGIFALERYIKEKYTVEAGVRYDIKTLLGYPLDESGIKTYKSNLKYENFTYTLGTSIRFNERVSSSLNLASAWRAPSVNELYISGVHLSAASYELGDSSLQSERSNGLTFSTKYESKKLNVEVGAYYQIIKNFIYSKPALKFINLVSGSYPAFNYTQTDAVIRGFDVDADWQVLDQVKVESKLSAVYATNERTAEWLVSMPADRLQTNLHYDFKQKSESKFSKSYISFNNTIVAQQTRIPENSKNRQQTLIENFSQILVGKTIKWDVPSISDYNYPTAGYILFDLVGSTTYTIKKQPIVFTLTVNNIFNTRYRDYLSRYRYFADDLGRVISLHVHVPFR